MTDVLTKGAALADRLRSLKVKTTQEMDALARHLDDTEKTTQAVFDRAHGFVKQAHAEVDDINEAVREISNALPTDAASKSPLAFTVADPSSFFNSADPRRDSLLVAGRDFLPAPGADKLPLGVPANIAAVLALKQGE